MSCLQAASRRSGGAVRRILFEKGRGVGGIEGTVSSVGMISSAPSFEDFFEYQEQSQNFQPEEKLFREAYSYRNG